MRTARARLCFPVATNIKYYKLLHICLCACACECAHLSYLSFCGWVCECVCVCICHCVSVLFVGVALSASVHMCTTLMQYPCVFCVYACARQTYIDLSFFLSLWALGPVLALWRRRSITRLYSLALSVHCDANKLPPQPPSPFNCPL